MGRGGDLGRPICGSEQPPQLPLYSMSLCLLQQSREFTYPLRPPTPPSGSFERCLHQINQLFCILLVYSRYLLTLPAERKERGTNRLRRKVVRRGTEDSACARRGSIAPRSCEQDSNQRASDHTGDTSMGHDRTHITDIKEQKHQSMALGVLMPGPVPGPVHGSRLSPSQLSPHRHGHPSHHIASSLLSGHITKHLPWFQSQKRGWESGVGGGGWKRRR